MRKCIQVVVFLCTVSSPVLASNCYVKLTNDQGFSPANRALIESYGGFIVHDFLNGEYICEMSVLQYEHLSPLLIVGRHSGSTFEVGPDSEENGIGFISWRLKELLPWAKTLDTTSWFSNQRFCGAVEIDSGALFEQAMEPQTSRTDMFPAEFAIGSNAVCLVIPESIGDDENWLEHEVDTAIAQAVIAYDNLSELGADRGIPLSWIYEIHRSVPVTEEPIYYKRPSYSFPNVEYTFGWVNDVLSHLGQADGWDGLFGNANRLRKLYRTDWGIMYCIVKNQNTRFFPDSALGYFTPYYAPSLFDRFRGPLAISTYFLRDGWTEASFSVILHETLHILGGADEYEGAPQCGGGYADACTHPWGFLAYNNENCTLCTSAQQSCIMDRLLLPISLCSATLHHIGWVDSDADGLVDPLDMNTDLWGIIPDVDVGDRVRIFSASGNTVRNIQVTEKNRVVDVSGSWIFWDYHNYQGQACSPTDPYYYVVHDGDPHLVPSYWLDQNTDPYVYDVGYSNDTLSFEIANSACVLDLQLWQIDTAGTGDSVLVAHPYWYKWFPSSVGMPHKTIDLSNINCTPCVAKFRTWIPEGSVGTPVEFEFSTAALEAPDFVSAGMHYDQFKQVVEIYFSDPNSREMGYVIERRPASTMVWETVDSLGPQEGPWVEYWDTTYTGSETYTYRVKAHHITQPDAYSDEVTLKTQPRWPANFNAYVYKSPGSCEGSSGTGKLTGLGDDPTDPDDPIRPTDSCLTNKIIVRWDEPENQLVPIQEYRVLRQHGPWDLTWYSMDTTGLEICPNSFNTDYLIQLVAFDAEGDSSKFQQMGVTTGSANACLSNITKGVADEADPTLPKTLYLSETYPNPFNPSTSVVLSLPSASHVTVTVYNSLGQRVSNILDGPLVAGEHVLEWNGRNDGGTEAASGVYFLRVSSEEFSASRKMLLVR